MKKQGKCTLYDPGNLTVLVGPTGGSLPRVNSPRSNDPSNTKKKDDPLANATPPRTPEEKLQRMLKKFDDQAAKVCSHHLNSGHKLMRCNNNRERRNQLRTLQPRKRISNSIASRIRNSNRNTHSYQLNCSTTFQTTATLAAETQVHARERESCMQSSSKSSQNWTSLRRT